MISGHTFHDTPHGLSCACGMRWVDLLLARAEHIGKPGWAHVGYLSADEYRQIEAERERVMATVRG